MSNGSKPLKILTNHGGQLASPTWRDVTTYVAPNGNDLWSSLKLAVSLYWKRSNFDCVVLGGGVSDYLFALLQTLLPFQTVPCVKIDCLWTKSPNRFRFLFHRTILKITSKSIDRFIVWAKQDIESFTRTFEIPREKFMFVPYHTTLDSVDLNSCSGEYIFSGGNEGRDYETLLLAVKGLPLKLLIASTRPELFAHMAIPENVEIKGFSHEEYLRKMAGCLINVVSLESGGLRTGGHQTYLNSMWLGKPTIVNDPDGACDYIEHMHDGFLVGPKDPKALRKAIEFLLSRRDIMNEIAIRAARKAKHYSTEEHFKKIISVALQVIREKSKRFDV